MVRFLPAIILFSLGSAALAPAAAQQGTPAARFLDAVKERDGNVVDELLNGPNPAIINSREHSSGRAALHHVIERRDETWLGFLLSKGANPNIADKSGTTPLLLATQLGWAEGAARLIRAKAAVDGSNSGGVTPLMLAVQLRDSAIMRLLLRAGASASKTDRQTGLSARDYAARDPRDAPLLALIDSETKAKTAPAAAATGTLDFSGAPLVTPKATPPSPAP